MRKYICTICNTDFDMTTPDDTCPNCGGRLEEVGKARTELIKAEQQLFGFVASSKGDSIVDLVSAMKLTQEEWNKLRDGDASYMPDGLKQLVDEYFTTKGEDI